uniref:Uncharacterized protein n=1 Tax=Arundo donax TaxID=35708 RepID=A0A0A8XNK8_ARUDO
MELSAAGSGEYSTSGKRRRHLKRSLEYPCVWRFRHRRLLAYLRRHRFHDTFGSLVLETDVFFSVEHLQGLARLGSWVDATKYIASFVPSIHVLGDEGKVFVNFVHMHNVLDSIAAGKEYGAFVAGRYERYLKENPDAPRGTVKLVRILLSVLNSEKLRASINWDLVRHMAADMIKDLIDQAPEFNDLLRMPNCPTRPHNILPIAFNSRPRRHVKMVDRVQASDLAQFYLQKKNRLPSSSHCQETVTPVAGLSFEATARLADVLAQSVEAGMCPVPRDQYPLAYHCNEGVPGAPTAQAILSTMTIPAKSYGISFETSAGTNHPMCAEAVQQYCVPRNNPKRSRTTGHQEFDTRKRQITGEFAQHSGLSSQAYCSLGDGSGGDVGSDMKSWSARSGDCGSPTEILSS